QLLYRCDRSGLSAVTVCGNEGVSAPSFNAGRHGLRPRTTPQGAGTAGPADGAARLVPVRLFPVAAPVEVVLPGGLVLRLTPGCDLDFVRTLIDTLEDRPC